MKLDIENIDTLFSRIQKPRRAGDYVLTDFIEWLESKNWFNKYSISNILFIFIITLLIWNKIYKLRYQSIFNGWIKLAFSNNSFFLFYLVYFYLIIYYCNCLISIVFWFNSWINTKSSWWCPDVNSYTNFLRFILWLQLSIWRFSFFNTVSNSILLFSLLFSLAVCFNFLISSLWFNIIY